MKKILQLSAYLIACTLIFTSCDPWEDESYHPDLTDDVIIPGVWKLTELNLEEPYDFNEDGAPNSNLMTETNCYQNELMSFLPNNTGVATSNSYASITIEGEDFSIECIEEVEETPFNWIQTQNTIAITIDGQTFNATLTGNKLSFVIPEGFYAGNTEEGGVEILQDITFIYTKQ